MCCEQDFLRQLRERGLRLTPQRELVLQALHDAQEHATAEEIYARVSVLSSAVDLSTVYRTLELLQAFNLVAQVDLGDGQYRYELLSLHGNHHHLKCRACGRLIRMAPEEVQPLIHALQVAHAFQAEPEHLIIAGLCASCQAAMQGDLKTGES
jgi:Fur family ferric uptake transcriptional regulator